MAAEARPSASSAVESQSQSVIVIGDDSQHATKQDINEELNARQSRLDAETVHSTEDISEEPNANKDTDTDSICSIEEISQTNAPKPMPDTTESVHDIEDVTEEPNAKKPRLDVTETICCTGESSEASVKKPRLYTKSILRSPEVSTEPVDRQRRNKSTSACVLLGLVKSRVRKLVADRQTADSSSDAPTAPLSSQTSSATSSPKVRTPPSEYIFFFSYF